MKTIFLIRHGETQANRLGIFRGRTDIPLSETGLKQADELRRYFQSRPVEQVFSSPLRRARETAAACFPGHCIILDELINNLDLGAWSGRPKREIQLEQPRQWQRWISRPERMVFPGGESLSDVYARCQRFLQKLTTPPLAVAVVSHRAVLKTMLAAALGLKDHYFWKFHLDNASVTELRHQAGRGFTLYRSNIIEHLSELVVEWN